VAWLLRKVRHNSTTLLKDRKPNSALNTLEIIHYSNKYNLSSTRQFNPFFIFSPYLEFYNFKLYEVSFVWKITSIPTTFVRTQYAILSFGCPNLSWNVGDRTVQSQYMDWTTNISIFLLLIIWSNMPQERHQGFSSI